MQFRLLRICNSPRSHNEYAPLLVGQVSHLNGAKPNRFTIVLQLSLYRAPEMKCSSLDSFARLFLALKGTAIDDVAQN